MGHNDIDRAEGTSSGDASGNPSAVFSVEQSYFDILERLRDEGFADALSGEAAYLVQCVSPSHLSPYLSLVRRMRGESGTMTVQEAHDILSFDRKYQSILFRYIGIVESQMRAQYAHRMEAVHGAFALYDPALFLRRKNYDKSMAFYSSEVNRQVRKSRHLRKVCEENNGKLPIEHGVECATLGTLSQLFANTADARVTERVSSSFGCTKTELTSWLRTVTDVRNICAHFDAYAVRRQIPSTPLKIAEMPEADNGGTFYIVLLLLNLMEQRVLFQDLSLMYTYTMRQEIKALVEQFERTRPGVIGLLGFPEDWEAQMDYAGGGQIVFAVPIEK